MTNRPKPSRLRRRRSRTSDGSGGGGNRRRARVPSWIHRRGASTSIVSTHVSRRWWPTPVCHGPSRTTTFSSPSTGMQRHWPPGGSADELPPTRQVAEVRHALNLTLREAREVLHRRSRFSSSKRQRQHLRDLHCRGGPHEQRA